MTGSAPAPLETWLAKHVAEVDQLRYAPSFRNRRAATALWERLIRESEGLEYVPALVMPRRAA